MRGLKFGWRCDTMLEGVFPARDANAPFIAGFKPGKPPFWMWGDETVPVEYGKIEKLGRHVHADRVKAEVFRAGATKSVAIESGHGIGTTAFQFRCEGIHSSWPRLA